jgi:heptosyltransferase-3
MENEEQDILGMVGRAENQADWLARRAVIIQPGAIGDCVLTLPLAQYLKTHFGIGSVQMLGRSHYIEYFPGRTCIDSIKDLDSIDLHRLFVNNKDFELEDDDSLISTFAGFEQIVSFLGEAGGDFENNLIYTANCSNPVEVTTLELKPDDKYKEHTVKFHLASFIASQSHHITPAEIDLKKTYITPCQTDLANGRKILESVGIKTGRKIAVIHPGSGGAAKCWHIDNFYMLAEQLCEKNIKVVFVLGPAEMERFKQTEINRLGTIAPLICDLTLTETFQLVGCANCFIGNDSGITHIAAASGIPTIACFGPTDPAQYAPLGPQVFTLKFDTSDFDSPCPKNASETAKQALKLLTS